MRKYTETEKIRFKAEKIGLKRKKLKKWIDPNRRGGVLEPQRSHLSDIGIFNNFSKYFLFFYFFCKILRIGEPAYIYKGDFGVKTC